MRHLLATSLDVFDFANLCNQFLVQFLKFALFLSAFFDILGRTRPSLKEFGKSFQLSAVFSSLLFFKICTRCSEPKIPIRPFL